MDDLVQDIYKTIEPLSDGKAIDITDQDIENFGESMKSVLRSWANPTHRDSNFSIRMSNVGKPVRRLWFDNKYKQSDSKPSAQTQIKFLYGHMLEELVKLFDEISLVHELVGSMSDEELELMIESLSNGQIGVA